jgi:hypothetical protein
MRLPAWTQVCRGPLVDAVDKICRIARASHEKTRLSALAAVQCLSWSAAVRVRRLSPDTFPQHSQQYIVTDGPGAGPPKNPANVCDVPRRHVFEQIRIISTRIEHWASARYSLVPHNTTDTETASPTVAPQTIGEGLVTFHCMTKPEEIRARALMPSNSKPCWSGAPFSYR